MKHISIAKDIIPIGEFKTSISKWIEKSKITGQPIVITQNGRPAAVVLNPTDYDRLNELQNFVESVSRGLSDSESNKLMSTTQLKSELKKRRFHRTPK
jgi:prevent-host-death family protein